MSKKSEKKLKRLKLLKELSEVYIKKLTDNQTEAESCLKDILMDYSIIFEFQKEFIAKGKLRICDFFINTKDGKGLVIELDGAYHYKRKQRKLDLERTEWLKANFGCHLRRFSNSFAIKKSDYLLEIIMSYNPIIYKN
jgi:very-short-patch-repair endonuclease